MIKTNLYDKIYILGAGFSKAFCSDMPTIKDLFLDKEKNKFPKLFDMIDRIKENGNYYFDFKNVESLVSYILSKEIFYSFEEEKSFAEIKYELLKYIHASVNEYEPNEKTFVLLKEFLKYCAENKILIITFNYDLFLEKAIDDIGENIRYDYGVSLKSSPYETEKINIGSYADELKMEILKPHGSFNWFSLKQLENSNIEDIILVSQKDEYIELYNEIPLYVPMTNTKHKYFNGNFYKIIWKKMKYYLENSKEINFIGYGFPRTDFDNLVFFCEFKEKIKDIVIYDEKEGVEREENTKRLEQIFDKSNIEINGAIEYIKKIV